MLYFIYIYVLINHIFNCDSSVKKVTITFLRSKKKVVRK